MSSIRIRAHAKINLHLRVGPRRADGYHDIDTIFQSLDLHDTLICDARPGPFALSCDAPGVPTDDSNLVARAARLLADAAGRPCEGVAVHIDKRIPTQAGLGGGSADAAAALVALARVWRIDTGTDGVDLFALGRRLGADVSFILHGGTMRGVGRGDDLARLPAFPPSQVLIVMPDVGVSTADAYRWHDEAAGDAGWPGDVPLPAAGGADAAAAWRAVEARFANDFEGPVGARHPAIPATLARLREAGASLARMSGSGASMFGLFETRDRAEAAAARLTASGWPSPGWRCLLTRTVAASEAGPAIGSADA